MKNKLNRLTKIVNLLTKIAKLIEFYLDNF